MPELIEVLSGDMGEQQLKLESLGRFQVAGQKPEYWGTLKIYMGMLGASAATHQFFCSMVVQ